MLAVTSWPRTVAAMPATQPTQRRARIRTPRVAYDLTRTAAACERAAAALGGSSRPAEVVTFVARLLPGKAERGLDRAVVTVLSQLAARRGADVDVVVDRARRALEEDGDDTAEIEDAVAALTARGLNGEMLCWATIKVEAYQHTGLVKQQANTLAPRFADHTADDLIGFGWYGLVLALRKFEPLRGNEFSTYAVHRIRGSIQDGVRAEGPLPKRAVTQLRKVSAAEEELAQRMSRPPSLEELAEHTGSDLERLRVLTHLRSPASVEELAEPDEDHAPSALSLSSGDDPAEEALGNELRCAVEEALQQLPPTEREAVYHLVVSGATVSSASSATGRSPRQLRDDRDRGLQRLATQLAAWAP